jgi:phosphoribosylglycinamide formyltransferase-1
MKLGVLVSGAGTNLGALLAAMRAGDLAPAEIAAVVSNRPGAGALERAAEAGVPAEVVDHRAFLTRADFEEALLASLEARGVEGVILAGFMRVLTSRFIDAFPGRIINTHPALCPAFPGVDAPRQAIEHGVKVSGCTVHLVDAGVDTGPIILQAAVLVEPDDTAETLHRRIQREEHRLLPEATRLLAAGRLRLEGRRVRIVGR